MIKEILREKKTMNHSRILHRNAKSLTLNFRLEKSYDDQLWSIVSKMFLNLLKLFHLNQNVNIYLTSNIFQLHISLKNKINLSEAGFVLLQFRWIALSFFKNTLHNFSISPFLLIFHCVYLSNGIIYLFPGVNAFYL